MPRASPPALYLLCFSYRGSHKELLNRCEPRLYSFIYFQALSPAIFAASARLASILNLG